MVSWINVRWDMVPHCSECHRYTPTTERRHHEGCMMCVDCKEERNKRNRAYLLPKIETEQQETRQ